MFKKSPKRCCGTWQCNTSTIQTLFSPGASSDERDQQNVGEAHSSGFLVLGKSCKDELYLCKLTIHPSAFIAWTNLCLPLQELKPSEPRVCVCCFAAGLAGGNPADPAPFHLAAAPRGCFAQLGPASSRDPRDHRQQPAVG